MSILWTFIVAMKIVTSDALIFPSEDLDNDLLTTLAEQLVSSFFKDYGQPCLTIVTDEGLLNEFNPDADLFILRVTPKEKELDCYSSLDDYLKASFEQNCFWWIIQVSKPGCFFKAWTEASFASFTRQNPRFFFLPIVGNRSEMVYDDQSLVEGMNDLIPGLLVARLNEGSDQWPIELLTNNFYDKKVNLIVLDDWSPENGFRLNANLFPDKVNNLNGKNLSISGVPYPSYVILNVSTENLDGAEVRILLLFCEMHNCSLSFIYDGNQWGEIHHENRTANGELGLVYLKKADFGVAANYLWLPYFNYIDYSAVYLEGGLTCLVPKERRLTEWKTPFKSFTPGMWFSVLICLLTSAATLYLATLLTLRAIPRLRRLTTVKKQFTTVPDSIVRSIGMAVLQQPTVLVPASPVRHIFTSFEFVYFVLSSMYAAQLASQLTIPQYTKPIDTVNELVERDLHWFSPSDIFIEGLIHSNETRHRVMLKNFKLGTYEEILKYGATGKYGLAVERMPGGHITELSYLTDATISVSHLMKENYFASPLTVALQKGSPYTQKINDLINKMLNAGLYFYWEADVTRRFQNQSIQMALQYASKVHVDDEPTNLSLSHVAGAFIIYGIGLTTSFGFLFGEIASVWLKSRRPRRLKIHPQE